MNLGELSWDSLKELGKVIVFPRTQPDEIVERAADAEVIITNKVVLTAEIIARLPKLRFICVLATGYNVVDTAAARERGIPVSNIPAYSTDSVVQMTFAHILNITNRVDRYATDNRNGKWAACKDFCYWDDPIPELSGLTLGIVGLGNIGKKVARIARLFGMEVYAATSKSSSILPEGIQKTTFKGLLGVCDILSLHCPLTDDTKGMINKKSIGMMKRGSVIINTARGGLVNEADVADALRSGQLSAYGADVLCKEPPSADNPLLKEPHAYITQHVAWATFDARQRLIHTAADNVRAFMENSPINVVN